MAAAQAGALGVESHKKRHRTGGAPEDEGCCQHLAFVWIPKPPAFDFSPVFKNYEPKPAETKSVVLKKSNPNQDISLISCLCSFWSFEPIKCH